MKRDTVAVGTVIENHGALFDVLLDGRVVHCHLRGKLKKDRLRQVAPIAAGDRVEVVLLAPDRGIVERVLPRESDLSRRAAGSVPLEQTLVANVDQAVVVFAAAEPRANLFFLDQFLAMASAGGLEQVICINKCDLVAREALGPEYATYLRIGYPVIFASAYRGDGVGELREALRERRSVLCGPSGVGKSSLLNAVSPGFSLRTTEIGTVTHKGRHTTAAISFLELPFGGWVADTPGLRQLGLWEPSPDALRAAFRDLESHFGQCRFSNCSHRHEEGCALRSAVQRGAVDARRLKSFLQMGGR